MKTLTCEELGGSCNQKLAAHTWEEMVKTLTTHIVEKHPDVAQRMKKMHEKDPKQWAAQMKPKWDNAPDT